MDDLFGFRFKLPPGVKPFLLYNLKEQDLKRVCKQMNLIDLIELCLCSENSRAKIKNLRLEADSLTMHEDWISLNFPWKKDPFFFVFTGDKSQIEGYRVIDKTNYFWCTNREESTISCCAKQYAKYLTALNFFSGLFKVKHYDCTVSKPFHKEKLPLLPKTVRNLKFDEEMTDASVIARVLKHFRVENELEILGEITELHVNMLTIPSIFLGNVTRLKVQHLLTLNNRTIEISQHSLTSHDINTLIKHWKTGSKKLKYLKIFDEHESLDLDEILEDLGATGWDPEKREKMYDLNGELVDLGEYMDVERDSDGRIASIGLVGDVFEMLVWDQGAESKDPKESVEPAELVEAQGAEPEVSKDHKDPEDPKEADLSPDSEAAKILDSMNWEKLQGADLERIGEFSRKLELLELGAEPKKEAESEKEAEPKKEAEPEEAGPSELEEETLLDKVLEELESLGLKFK